MTTTLGKYELIEQLGKGGFGTVYRAMDRSLEREVALKILHPQLMVDESFITKFWQEAKILAKLDHPNIVPIYERGEDEARVYIAMKYLPGGSLSQLIARQGRLSWEQTNQIMQDVCAGLQAGHKQGLVHRDIKPSNILFDADGRAVLSDFGLARAVQVSGISNSSSMGMVGTPSYRAPELWRGKPPSTPATDVYSLACILAEMLGGNVIFGGETTDEILTRHLIDGPDLPEKWDSDVPEKISDFLKRCFSKELSARPQDAVLFEKQLRDLKKEQDAVLKEPPRTEAVLEVTEVDKPPEISKSLPPIKLPRKPLSKKEWTWYILAGVVGVIAITTLGLILGIQKDLSVATEAPQAETAIPVLSMEETEAPARNGAWVDELVFTAIEDQAQAISQIQAGELDMYAYGIEDAQLFDQVKNDPSLSFTVQSSAYIQILFNPVVCSNYSILNPFSNMKIREAMNWVIDRDYIAQEIYGGLAVPRLTSLTSSFPDYSRYSNILDQMTDKYGYDLQKAQAVVDEQMYAMGAWKDESGKWQYQNRPVTIIGLIRTEDQRQAVGAYFADQLEQLGFTVDRQFKARKEASPIWQADDPYTCVFNFYTALWINTAISRDEGSMFASFSSGKLFDTLSLFNTFQPSAAYDDVMTRLMINDFSTLEERDSLFEQAIQMDMEESWHGIFIVDSFSFEPMRSDLQVASDLVSGIANTKIWSETIRYREQEGGTVRIAQPGILVAPWNPIAGSTWIYDAMPQFATEDFGTIIDPFSGLALPQRIEYADCVAQTGTPTFQSSDWVDLQYEDNITVPGYAWVDWDAANQVWITADEKFPEGISARTKCTVYYPDNIWSMQWHDGSYLSFGDFVFYMIMNFDPYKPESSIYDENYAVWLDDYLTHFKGIVIESIDPLIITTYEDQVSLDIENSVTTWYPVYAYGQVAWHNLLPAILAEQSHELAFSEGKSMALMIDQTNLVTGPSLDILKRYLDQAQVDNRIPYYATLSAYITSEEAYTRYANLQGWYTTKGHFWIGLGPFYLDLVDQPAGRLVLKRWEYFPDLATKWSDYEN